MTGLDLAALVTTTVADEIERMNGHLDELVAKAADEEIRRRVHALVEQNLNGRDDEARQHEPADDAEARATKTCVTCGETQPLDPVPAEAEPVQAVRGAGASTTSCCGAGTSPLPFRREWRWVAVDALAARGHRRGFVVSTLHGLIARGWLESDGNGRVRPTELFPADLVTAFATLYEQRRRRTREMRTARLG